MAKQEAKIFINGTELTEAQSMALRCAIEGFDRDLSFNGLGDDELGLSICKGYRDRIVEIRSVLYKHL